MAAALGGSLEDYGWFTPADLRLVAHAIHRLSQWKNVVLVGGQSLTAWVKYYRIDLPPFEGPYLTADADFLASKADAELLARYLNGRARYPGLDDHGPNTAVIDFTGEEGKLLHIDVLWAVLGIKDEDVRRWAVPIQIDDMDPVTVLHPLLVLESRCVNLYKLDEKRHANGVTQARVACLVAQRYIDDCLSDPGRRRNALDAAKRIARLAQSNAGVFVFHQWNIDVMAVVPPDRMPGQFTKSWPHEVQRTAKRRRAARKLAVLRVHQASEPAASAPQTYKQSQLGKWLADLLKDTTSRLLVLAATAIGAAILAYWHNAAPKPAPAAQPPPSVASTPAAVEPQPITPISLRDYLTAEHALHGRFAEEDHFREEWKGKRVQWRGYVHSASTGPGAGVILFIGLRTDRASDAAISYPLEFKPRVLELRPGDVAEVVGTISRADREPILQGETLKLVQPAK